MTVDVVGGLYREECVRPQWDRVFGSAGRAAVAIASMGVDLTLHCYSTQSARNTFMMEAALLPLALADQPTEQTPSFRYLHDSAPPAIRGVAEPALPPLRIEGEKVLRFGMLESDAIVRAVWAVYDPQNVGAPKSFSANGSQADYLALVLNAYEARTMAGLPLDTPPEVCAETLGRRDDAAVVVIKLGPAGALVWTEEGVQTVPAYRTKTVWKIGSGDTFAAHFALAWMHEGKTPVEAADWASRATAFYCENRILPTAQFLSNFTPEKITTKPECRAGKRPNVYLAGPFFDIAQVWLIEETLARLTELGLEVFSPFHDIGLGAASDVVHQDLEAIQRCDIVFAIADGLDAGTLYEIGYARALDKPVVVLSERESDESMKMAEGSGCVVCRDFTTALYSALWKATCE
ncbi:PfkB family carbohydrate kinase [Variovorax sp. J22R24]|uniref:PfkB family carbohydrate kinase n=1 Tax=Variovorax gracilis TaxID=3053502 RepID=UPI002575C715|nr:PfkB family carbohydrate kinase [Variovorax sp. J22R24]MDM0108663.1 PfkB family carbohydrate kinase [Variovorax sp. J22R24]